MSITQAPSPANRAPNLNRIGLDLTPYKGARSTLCAGCGHNAIAQRITEVCFELGLPPWQIAKISGIGCSSKSPAYFLGASHGFNGAHGRAAPLATGAILANRTLKLLVVTGDGDTASIGMGHFVHMLRRNIPMVYVVENNGVYGLTKGQFSATADRGARLKSGELNELPAIDLCLLAIEMGASFVARSFSGDKSQMQAILKAAFAHYGLALIDVISPCTTFNDHPGSTKSYAYMRDHDEPLHNIDFIPAYEEIQVEMAEGEVREIRLHDGSLLRLHKLGRDYDPTDKEGAIRALHQAASREEVLTGILYIEPQKQTFLDLLDLCPQPLASLPPEKLRPSRQTLEQIMEELR